MISPRRRLAVGGGVLAVGLVVLGLWLSNEHNTTPARATRPLSIPPTTATTSTAGSSVSSPKSITAPTQPPPPTGAAIAADTLVATIRSGGAPGSHAPYGPLTIEIPGQWLGAASILPVLAQQAGRVEVRLAQRPNQSTAWVPAGYVSLATDPFYIVINLTTTHLLLFNRGQKVGDFPAGIGVASAPTPTGHFFVALFAKGPSAGYGPFVLVTSGHSNTISDWEESGDAITAIHGPLGADAAIGTTGARVSHGCIRLHDADLAQLRDVPAGTPIDVIG
jgi:lipoprotein-anchoring transpeptidase ErfK/SrfK